MHPIDIMAEAFENELVKIAQAKQASAKSLVLPAVAGAGIYELLRRANHDRKLGRAVRKQQGQY
jgi:hypothetical protein